MAWSEERIMQEAKRMSDEELYREWAAASGKKRDPGKPRWVYVLGLQYHRMILDRRARGLANSDKMLKRYRLAMLLNTKALRQESDFLGPAYDERNIESKGEDMKKGRKAREKKITASSVLIELLGAGSVKKDETLIAEVKHRTGSSKFDEKQLAWYKWKYRQGKLKGMDGKLHEIAQGSNKKAEKQPKAKKKIVIKDRRAKEAVAA